MATDPGEDSEGRSGAVDDENDRDAKRRKLIQRRKLKLMKIRTDKSAAE